MVESTILDMIHRSNIGKWEEEVKIEMPEYAKNSRDKAKAELLAECTEKGAGILQDYERELFNYFYEGNYLYCVKLLNTGIKIGMEIQQGFEENRE